MNLARIGVTVALAVIVIAAVLTIVLNDALGLLWLATFAVAVAAVGAILLAVRLYNARGRRRAEQLVRRLPGAVIVASVATPGFIRQARAVARLLGEPIVFMLPGWSLSLVATDAGLTVYAGSREPFSVLSVARDRIDRVGRSTNFGLSGTPVSGVEFIVELGGQRRPLQVYVPLVRVRRASEQLGELLG